MCGGAISLALIGLGLQQGFSHTLWSLAGGFLLLGPVLGLGLSVHHPYLAAVFMPAGIAGFLGLALGSGVGKITHVGLELGAMAGGCVGVAGTMSWGLLCYASTLFPETNQPVPSSVKV